MICREYTTTELDALLVGGGVASSASFQRLLKQTHVDKIAADIMQELKTNQKSISRLYLPGCLILCKDNSTEEETYYLVDGNHRMQAYRQVLQQTGCDLTFWVQMFTVGNEKEAKSIYDKVNYNESVPEMPKYLKSMNIPNTVTSYFQNKYREAFSKENSKKTNRPYINFTKFLEAVCKLSEKQPDLSAADIISILLEENKKLQNTQANEWKRFKVNRSDTRAQIEKLLRKCDNLQCFFGMFRASDYYSQCFAKMSALQNNNNKKEDAKTKAAIGSVEEEPIWDYRRKFCRNKLWNETFGQSCAEGKCALCKGIVFQQNYTIDHKIPLSQNGEDVKENCQIVCASCNSSKGSFCPHEKNKQ
jgi:5-methylcytosine-specific restriction endonuclease McrA